MELRNIEFSNKPNGEVEVRITDKPVFTLSEKDTDLIDSILLHLEEFYPDCESALKKDYARFSGNRLNYKFRQCRRFLRCNFGRYDSQLDIDNSGVFHFEEMDCPRIGECKYHNEICNPRFETELTTREMEVMQLYCSGFKADQIADRLYISISTVETHKNNSLRKKNIHSLVEFIAWSNKYNIFKNL